MSVQILPPFQDKSCCSKMSMLANFHFSVGDDSFDAHYLFNLFFFPSDCFIILVPIDMDVKTKATLIGAVFLIVRIMFK